MDLTPRTKFECPTCYKTFKLKRQLAWHLVTHAPDAQVKCKVCGKISKNPVALSRHMKNLHTNWKRPSCDICQIVFSTLPVYGDTPKPSTLLMNDPVCHKQNVSRHVRAEHAENPVRFRCTLCGKEFKMKIELESHVPTHTTEKPYNCATCGRSFALRRTMKSHEQTHLEKSARDIFQCHVCPGTFLKKGGLQAHVQVVHENRRNYPCTICDKRFSSSSELKRHVEARHVTNKELVHSCDKCEYRSYSKVNLTHPVRRHNPANWRKCYFCNKFITLQNLVKHYSRIHCHEK
ncbi:PR domain zinc finger protein 5 [Folsomia candida]|uniref:PR domain zinc finger protein 5 n=1 Tax=Folsomia candida TaxID=158441 RepID=A0A226DMG5_FOLCA|nr:PR domain zinc finger protein 5 [Folsomia candida]